MVEVTVVVADNDNDNDGAENGLTGGYRVRRLIPWTAECSKVQSFGLRPRIVFQRRGIINIWRIFIGSISPTTIPYLVKGSVVGRYSIYNQVPIR